MTLAAGEPPQFAWDFFIAHSGGDKQSAEELHQLITPRRRVFLDSKCLLPGDDWDLVLPKAQSESRITVALLSEHADQTHYLREEIATALALARNNANLHRVVPVFLTGTVPDPDDLPYGLRTKHAIALGTGGLPGVARQLLNLADSLDGKSPELQAIEPLVQRIDYQHAAKSIPVLRDLIAHLRKSGSQQERRLAANAMKDIVLNMGDFEGAVVPARIREMRRLALDVIRLAAAGGLGSEFAHRELEYLDMYGMNFAYEDLRRVSFRGCFLVECDFQSCYLAGASFSGAYIRNANFKNADLTEADFTNADWFNAAGLTAPQLQAARAGTLLKCPPDIAGMHGVLKARYLLPFDSWSDEVQQQLQRTWATYLESGGFCAALGRQS